MLFCIKTVSFAQFFPDKGFVFNDTEVPKIYITLNEADLSALLEPGNEYSDYEYPATFKFESSTVTETVDNVGFRLRGNTSRVSQKKSFKIAFNAFTSGKKFHGLEKMNLNGEHNDPTITRSKLCFDLFRQMNIPASRANHVELYVNNEYKGLYLNVEHIDEEFIKLRFGNNDGNLYKCLWPADLSYQGDSPDDYKLTNGDRRAYELKTNKDADDYTDLADFLIFLNNASNEDFKNKIEEKLNLNSFLRYLAIEFITGHWDGYSYNKNNFYLYKNTKTNKFEFIPYDMDNTFGIDWFNEDWAKRNIYEWTSQEDRPLTERILEIKEYKDRFSFYVKKLLDNHFNQTTINDRIDAIKPLISESAKNDSYRAMDYGWSFSDFEKSFSNALSDHVSYGLISYVSERNKTANQQLVLNNIAPIISQLKNSELAVSQDFSVSVHVDDETTDLGVNLFYKINDGDLQSVQMQKADEIGNGFFKAIINKPLSDNGKLSYYIKADDKNGNSTTVPKDDFIVVSTKNESNIELYINEIMASNKDGIRDENGEFEDWVEIYNAGSEKVWLGDKYLSDNASNPDKWQMPEIYIEAGEFLLIWADNDEEQGEKHASFKLSQGGEEIGIYDKAESNYAEIDYFAFGEQSTDISYGRTTDGGNDLDFLTIATPEQSNNYTSVSEPKLQFDFKFYPNPVKTDLYISLQDNSARKIQVDIYNLNGKMIYNEQLYSQKSVINLANQNISSGIYLLKLHVFNSENKVISSFSEKLIIQN